jgi:hypothetical protein
MIEACEAYIMIIILTTTMTSFQGGDKAIAASDGEDNIVS